MFQMWSPHVEICEDVKSTYGDMWRYVEGWSPHVKICGAVMSVVCGV